MAGAPDSCAAQGAALGMTGPAATKTECTPRTRVLAAAEELYYYPNAFARNPKKRKTYTLRAFIAQGLLEVRGGLENGVVDRYIEFPPI